MTIQGNKDPNELLSDLKAMFEILTCININDLPELNAWLRKVRLAYIQYKNSEFKLCAKDFSSCSKFVRDYIDTFLNLESDTKDSAKTKEQKDDELKEQFLGCRIIFNRKFSFDTLVSEVKASIKNKNVASGLTYDMLMWYNQNFMADLSPVYARDLLEDALKTLADTGRYTHESVISRLLKSFDSDGNLIIIDDEDTLFKLCKLVIGLYLLYKNFSVYQRHVTSENDRRYFDEDKHRTFVDSIKGKNSKISFFDAMIRKIKLKYNITDENYISSRSKKSIRFVMKILGLFENRKISLEAEKEKKLSDYVSGFYKSFFDKIDCTLGKDILILLFVKEGSTKIFDMFDVIEIPSEREKLKEWETVFSGLRDCHPERITFPDLDSEDFKTLYDYACEYVCSWHVMAKQQKHSK